MKSFWVLSAGWMLNTVALSQLGPIGRSPAGFAICFLLGFVLMAFLVRTCPRQWPRQRIIWAVVLLGVLGRAAFIGFPVGNDLYRYIWEGYIQHHGFNPYLVSPDHPSLQYLIQGDMVPLWQQINHKDLSAVYPPLVMLLFRGLAAVSTSPLAFKGAMVAFDLATLAALIGILHRKRISPVHLFWYAANPLVLVYVAGEAHLDSVQAAFITLGVYCHLARRPWATFFLLGLAVVSKYLSLVLLPFFMKRSNRRAWPAALAAVIWFLPFAGQPAAIFDALMIFGGQMHYNDGLGELLRILASDAAVPLLALILFAVLSAIYLLEHDTLRSAYLAIGAVLLCLPTLHPWYLMMVAPLMALYPSRAWLYLMLASVVTLPVQTLEYKTGVFEEIRWLKLVAYLPFLGLLVFGMKRPRRRSDGRNFPEARRVSVVIPTLNERAHIARAIRSAQESSCIEEIVVADGGSSDATQEIAQQYGAQVVTRAMGRGRQVRAGIRETTGDVILVLHADTILMPGAVDRMREALAANPSAAGGAFGMRFKGASPGFKLIAWLNNIRAAGLGISFGDQGQFFRQSALEKEGGFPDMMLMEDVELSMRMKRYGSPLFIRNGVQVSNRRWTHRGFGRNAYLVTRLFFGYLLERRFKGPSGVRTDYYGKYYKGG